jgi:putative endonuclease
VYLLESVEYPEETYVGLTDDLRSRFVAHNAGRSPHTAKFKPWRLVTYIAFSDERKAIEFEKVDLAEHSPASGYVEAQRSSDGQGQALQS